MSLVQSMENPIITYSYLLLTWCKQVWIYLVFSKWRLKFVESTADSIFFVILWNFLFFSGQQTEMTNIYFDELHLLLPARSDYQFNTSFKSRASGPIIAKSTKWVTLRIGGEDTEKSWKRKTKGKTRKQYFWFRLPRSWMDHINKLWSIVLANLTFVDIKKVFESKNHLHIVLTIIRQPFHFSSSSMGFTLTFNLE